VRSNVALCFEPVKGGINRADRNGPLRSEFDLLADGDTVGAIFKAEQCQDDDVLELSERIAAAHYPYNLDEMEQSKQMALPLSVW
jgi:hypothetical protein